MGGENSFVKMQSLQNLQQLHRMERPIRQIILANNPETVSARDALQRYLNLVLNTGMNF